MTRDQLLALVFRLSDAALDYLAAVDGVEGMDIDEQRKLLSDAIHDAHTLQVEVELNIGRECTIEGDHTTN